jgi:hypothetical protein
MIESSQDAAWPVIITVMIELIFIRANIFAVHATGLNNRPPNLRS